MTIHLNQYPVLVLNADYSPKSVFPLSIINWHTAAKQLWLDRYTRVADYDRVIRTRGNTYVLPSVVAMKEYHPIPNVVPFNRHNIYVRDEGRCAYCRCPLTMDEFTFDHVDPVMNGGETTWDNIVCSCAPCNNRKGHKQLKDTDLKLHVRPGKPSVFEIAKKARALGRAEPTPVEWADFLYWQTELER